MLRGIIKRNFANWRGLIRTLLSDIRWRLGGYKAYRSVDWEKVERLVFVCQGNICRSPFAHYVAAKREIDLPVVSIGLATTTGVAANDVAISVASDHGVNLKEHRATDISDFAIKEGDLFMVMEDRHIDKLMKNSHGESLQIGLLGLWCEPPFALLYDPFMQERTYFDACFGRIKKSVENLLDERQSQSLD